MKRWPFEWDGISRGNNLVVFYYLGSSEIWPDKRGDFEEDYCTTIKKSVISFEPFQKTELSEFEITKFRCYSIATYNHKSVVQYHMMSGIEDI